jgi:hypothetical protein
MGNQITLGYQNYSYHFIRNLFSTNKIALTQP